MGKHVNLLGLVLVMSACGRDEPSPLPEGTDPGDVGKRLVQLFGPMQEAGGRDIFFAAAPRSAEVRRAEPPSLPLLVGIVLQGGVPAAYFVDAGQSHTYREGGRIAGRYTIVRIAPSFVILEDTQTGKAYRVALTGS